MYSDLGSGLGGSDGSTEPLVFHSLGEEISCYLVKPKQASTEAPPIVIVSHGAGDQKENYLELAQHLAQNGFASLLVDMHGHGASGGHPFQVRMKEWVADLQAAADYLETREDIDSAKIAAFGLSSGGTAILEASVVDSRFKALIVLDGTVKNTLPPGATLKMTLLGWIGALKRVVTGTDLKVSLLDMLKDLEICADPDINEHIRSQPGKLRAFAKFPLPGAIEAFFVDTIKRVHLVKAPTLVIWGEEDKLDPVSTAHELFAKLRCQKDLKIIPGNGHAGHLDRHRQQVLEATAEWLQRIFH
jgi:alpha-beta hydrolase superfamily lysophospholipase